MFEFIMTSVFDKRWAEMGLNDDDLAALQAFIQTNPRLSPIISGTGGVRKLRFAFDGRGKSGSSRVLYVEFASFEKIYLITAYSKGKQDNISDEGRNNLKKLVAILKSNLGGK